MMAVLVVELGERRVVVDWTRLAEDTSFSQATSDVDGEKH